MFRQAFWHYFPIISANAISMKRVFCVLGLILALNAGYAQINEKDTTVTTIINQYRSVVLEADVLPDYINLHWRKGRDEYINRFELYRSPDGIAYTIVKQFVPKTFDGRQDYYSFKDDQPLQGKNYYRLVGYNQFTNERTVVDLMAEYKNQPRRLQPTLITRGNQLNITNYDGDELFLYVFTSTGAPVLQRNITSSPLNFSTDNLARGLYVYQILDRRKYVVNSGKFILQ
jgi:hypothetical protein